MCSLFRTEWLCCLNVSGGVILLFDGTPNFGHELRLGNRSCDRFYRKTQRTGRRMIVVGWDVMQSFLYTLGKQTGVIVYSKNARNRQET